MTDYLDQEVSAPDKLPLTVVPTTSPAPVHAPNFCTFPSTCIIIQCSGHMPVIPGANAGVGRRVILVPWPVKKRDKQLTDKLSQELPGILEWAERGYHGSRGDGLSILAASLVAANAEYRRGSDIIGMWLENAKERQRQKHD